MRGLPLKSKDHNGLKFVNELGEKFESIRAAIENVKIKNPANLVDIQKLCKFTRMPNVGKELERTVAAKKCEKEIDESKESERGCVIPPKNKKNEKVKLSEVKQPTDDGWREDDLLPKGWKTKGKSSKPVKGKADYEAFLTPSGKHLSSRIALIDQLKREGEDVEWIELARSGLGHFGWVQEARLPQGFLRREHVGKVEFFTPECKRVEGYAKLLELLLQEGYGFKVKIISKLWNRI